jgi:predicted DNA binding protein
LSGLLHSRFSAVHSNRRSPHSETFALSDLYTADIKDNTIDEDVEFANEKLNLTHLRRYSSAATEHAIHLCADEREVCEIRLSNEIKALSGKLSNEEGEYFYACYVQGKLLNERVNSQRTGFNFSQEGELNLDGH